MQEKIDDILGEPLVETEENKKMIRTPHGELPNYSVGERFGIGNRVRKKVKVLSLNLNLILTYPKFKYLNIPYLNILYVNILY